MMNKPESSPNFSFWKVVDAIALGIIGTFFANIPSAMIMMAIAPRHRENIRDVVSWPFPPFALGGVVLTLLIVYVIALNAFKNPKLRILIVCVAAIELYWINNIGILRRFHIGKF